MPVNSYIQKTESVQKRCLKCNEWFKSLDPIYNRLCTACNKKNEGYNKRTHGKSTNRRVTRKSIKQA